MTGLRRPAGTAGAAGGVLPAGRAPGWGPGRRGR
jgi:hypothetical protein